MTLNNINAIMLGSSEINTIYLGTNIVWTKNNSNQNEEDVEMFITDFAISIFE